MEQTAKVMAVYSGGNQGAPMLLPVRVDIKARYCSAL